MPPKKSRNSFFKEKIVPVLAFIRRRSGLVTILVVSVVFLYLLLLSNRGTISLYRHHSEKEELQQQIETLEQKKTTLMEEIERLKNDKDYIEKIAREKYNMKKPDEKVFRVDSSAQ